MVLNAPDFDLGLAAIWASGRRQQLATFREGNHRRMAGIARRGTRGRRVPCTFGSWTAGWERAGVRVILDSGSCCNRWSRANHTHFEPRPMRFRCLTSGRYPMSNRGARDCWKPSTRCKCGRNGCEIIGPLRAADFHQRGRLQVGPDVHLGARVGAPLARSPPGLCRQRASEMLHGFFFGREGDPECTRRLTRPKQGAENRPQK
jgi:hypothetical protein